MGQQRSWPKDSPLSLAFVIEEHEVRCLLCNQNSSEAVGQALVLWPQLLENAAASAELVPLFRLGSTSAQCFEQFNPYYQQIISVH